MRALYVIAALLLLARPAAAAELEVRLTGRTGAALSDVVVMVKPKAGVPRGALRQAGPYRMAQRHMQFEPFVMMVPVGAEVSFPNLDPFRHHVYSFSPAKVFELKLYSRDETRMVKFDKPGSISVGCNIHDNMSAYIRVVDTPFAAKSGANGTVVIEGLPSGPATVTLWHPYLKAPGAEISRDVTISSGRTSLPVSLDLRAPLRRGAY